MINLGSGSVTTNDLLSGISGGSLFSANHYVGYSGTGSFSQSRGTNTISNRANTGTLIIGFNAGSSGTYNLSGSGLLSSNYEWVGYSGTGGFAQSGGTNNANFGVTLGDSPGSVGSYNLSGGLLSRSVSVGMSGTGVFTKRAAPTRPMSLLAPIAVAAARTT